MVRRRSRRTSTPPPAELREDELPSEEGEDDEEEEEEESEVEVEPNLLTRVKRQNAGNRMQQLLEDELGAITGDMEEIFKEEENDVEFKQKEEEDVFDSDFGSTDEEGSQGEDDEEAGERRLEREAKAEQKAAKAKKKKGFVAPSHPFARTTKDQARKAFKASSSGPVASTSASTLDDEGERPAVKRKRVSMDPAFLAPQRESSRRSALEFKQGVQDRLQESEKRKSTAKKPRRKTQKTLTQADLIAEALETEEINRAALLAFYAAEEDRREAERIAGMRYEIIGPKLTFLSRTEGRVERKDKGKGKEEKGRRRMIEVLGETGQKGWKGGVGENVTGEQGKTDGNEGVNANGDTSAVVENPSTELDQNSTEPLPWTRNWLVFDQFEGTRADEYEALFGDHVDWNQPVPPRGDLKLTRCALTGLPARYRDPRTLAPYATLEAYQVLNSIVDNQAFIWSDSLGAYTGTSGFGLAREVESTWGRRPSGKIRYATSTDLPPAPVPMAARPPPRHSSSRQGSGKGKARMVSTAPKEDNPYGREYAHSGGTGRGSRGRTSLIGGEQDFSHSPAPVATPPIATHDPNHLPPLPPSNGFPPLPTSNGSASPLPPLPSMNDVVGQQVAPQARQIQLSSTSNGGGIFGSSPHHHRNSSPFGPVPTHQPSSPFAASTNRHPPRLDSPSLPPLPSHIAGSPFQSDPSPNTLNAAVHRQSPLPQ